MFRSHWLQGFGICAIGFKKKKIKVSAVGLEVFCLFVLISKMQMLQGSSISWDSQLEPAANKVSELPFIESKSAPGQF